ncbi:DUF2142 domain-containing protein [Streptococcus pseudoporcinus]|uniref:Membrane protein, PF09913 family n=1 Tax=Streptococcus pseudoporcinus LQ 940-04 TaxID=875093 RepID=G5K6T1_9STRE|nr:DUF2142 domain-containing protein [Streptococcus pseudoporcinus]EFR44259.1 hypothetical protein HMPREF9320_1818 [Streptococcus pseudoporcinus SPIN 20026]EHI65961.1 hypothetical protein STRPS_0169 [Streptococcus pseudoporcinus LQ 940-04]VEF94630.1 Predicted membrane protein [Streptococcus pseudoporcinus]
MKEKALTFFDNIFSDNSIHKTFLVVGLMVTMSLSIFMPFFNEPDGQYHLAVSGRIVNKVIDTSKYGEYSIASGMKSQKESYQDGTRFEKYYLNKANFVSWKDAPREVNYSIFNFVFGGHVLPAIGLKIGSYIYPSMGVMITVARLFSSFVSIISLTLIIKYLRNAKMIYFAVFLSPVALNAFASLSYDATGYLITASLIAVLINILSDHLVTKRRLIILAFISLLLLLACKQNYWLLLLLIPISLLQTNHSFAKKMTNKVRLSYDFVKSHMLIKIVLILLALGVFYLVCRSHGGIFVVIRRYLMTFGYNYSGTDLLSNDITSWLAAPYPTYNFIPTWISAVWYLLFFAVLFTEKKFIKSRQIGLIFLVTFFVGIFGVYFIMLEYNGARTSYIEGVQGRYFTPTLVLLQVFASSIKLRIEQNGQKIVPIALLCLILVSNGLLLFDTVISLILR